MGVSLDVMSKLNLNWEPVVSLAESACQTSVQVRVSKSQMLQAFILAKWPKNKLAF